MADTRWMAPRRPSGQVSTTGVTELALGGGIGYLSRRHGMTGDSLRACDMVTADGSWVRVSVEGNPELLWGFRGAGHDVAVVSGVQFLAHPLNSSTVTEFIVSPIDQTREVLIGDIGAS